MTVPPDVLALAASRDLGDLDRIFPSHRRLAQLLGIGFCALVFGALAIGFHVEPPPGLAEVRYFFDAIPVLLLIWAAAIASRSPLFSAEARRRCHYAFAHGYIQVTRRGMVAHRWDEVLALLIGAEPGPGAIQLWADLHFADGTRARLKPRSTDMLSFAPYLDERITAVQAPRARAALDRGQTIEFGDIAVTRNGVTVGGGGEIPWLSVADLSVGMRYEADGFLRLRGEGRLPAVRASKRIPNLMTLLCVAEERRSGSRGGGAFVR
jgi:hypothetical protein